LRFHVLPFIAFMAIGKLASRLETAILEKHSAVSRIQGLRKVDTTRLPNSGKMMLTEMIWPERSPRCP